MKELALFKARQLQAACAATHITVPKYVCICVCVCVVLVGSLCFLNMALLLLRAPSSAQVLVFNHKVELFFLHLSKVRPVFAF
jgi:hypothetical protein